MSDADKLAAVLWLCVRERTHNETPAAEKFVVEIPGWWGQGFPTRTAAELAILDRAVRHAAKGGG